MFILDKGVAFLAFLCDIFDVTPEDIAKSKGIQMRRYPILRGKPDPRNPVDLVKR